MKNPQALGFVPCRDVDMGGYPSTLGGETFLPTSHGGAVYSEFQPCLRGALTNEMLFAFLCELVFAFLTPDIALRQEYAGEDTEDSITLPSLVFEPQRTVHLLKTYL